MDQTIITNKVDTMKAMVVTKFGSIDGLELQDIDRPINKGSDILIQVKASSITAGDVMVRSLTYPLYVAFWLFSRVLFGQKNIRKKILGHEYAGIVIDVGEDVKEFKIGDNVFGTTSGLSSGSHAEYICVPDNSLIFHMPIGIEFTDAAGLSIGGNTALYLLRKADIQVGDHILINGASGSVGTYAIQLSKLFGAHVSAVTSKKNDVFVRSIGADEVIDYKKTDFTTMDKTYDVVLDAVGNLSKCKCKVILKTKGRFVTVQSMIHEERENIMFLRELLETGQLKVIIDRSYSLDQLKIAHEYVESKRKRGNVIIAL